ncbi:MAG: ABC transporter ATP-binding protein [Acidobacteriota bacterium]|nr:MAG: ABC transporter ATP-binding protein [Acidobacteriota bacterium]
MYELSIEVKAPALSVEQVKKVYNGGETPVEAVRGVSIELPAGDFVALMGPSGCGKSTLLHLCGAMDRPTAGRILIDRTEIGSLSDDRLTEFRRRRIGFVFQFFNLLPTLTALENISLPLLLDHRNSSEADRLARELAGRVGLSHRLHHYPQQLSGGEMQRAAIARAVIHRPALLIADEPTGNLDSENGRKILQLLNELNEETGITILMATHSEETAAAAKRIVGMRDGEISRK